jgi:conjugal transfer ATP-binding protein TraC
MLTSNSSAGVTKADIAKQSTRDKLSDFLPWLFADDDLRYLNMDNTEGYIWECIPLAFSFPSIKKFESLLKAPIPEKTVIQFMLYADPNVSPILDRYRANKHMGSPLVQLNVEQYTKHIENGNKGLKALYGIPTRDFRLFVTIKNEHELSEEMVAIFEEGLKSAGLAPRRMPPTRLIQWMRNYFNNPYVKQPNTYDSNVPIRKQVIDADTVCDFTTAPAKIGDTYFRCMTPKIPCGRIDSLKANSLLGGHKGIEDDQNQIACPFLYTMTIIVDDKSHKEEITSRSTTTMMQKAGGSFAKKLSKRIEEYSHALEKMDNQEKYYKVIPTLWLLSHDRDELNEMSARARRLWEEADFVMQTETRLARILFISSLPFGFYHIDDNIDRIDRHFYFSSKEIARLLPVQTEFRPVAEPVLLFVGRKGQLLPIDLFSKRATNYNFVVSAQSGGGKSFSLNNLCNSYFSSGAAVRIVDLGGSYYKSCKIAGGRYLDFDKEKMVSNPFDFFGDKEDIERCKVTCRNILSEMVYSASGTKMQELEWTLLSQAIEWVDKNGNHERGVDSVREYLKSFPDHYQDDGEITQPEKLDFAINSAREMAFNITEFTTKGRYGHFFNGQSTFDISKDHFVVLELESLQGNSELLGVVMLQMMNAVTQDLYLSKRDKPRFILFEEAATILKSQGNKDLSRLASVIEEGYRRARKYKGSFGVVLQSLLDTMDFGPVGKVILSNAAYKFYLSSSDYAKAAEEKIIPYEGVDLDILMSVKNNNPNYSEMFIDSPLGAGVARLTVDPWTYWVNTSDPDHVMQYFKEIENGLTNIEAISKLSGVRLQEES